MNGSILEAKDTYYAYSKKGPKVLDCMCIDIHKGVRSALLGANGAGKSTLFSVLNALYKPEKGTILFDGQPLSYRHKGILKMRAQVSILFQNPNDMMFKPYVEQDVAYGPENLKLPKEEVEKRVEDALFAVGMQDFRKQPIMKLSYGQRKRVTLAGVLAMRPSVLIMDEPTAGLDPQMAYEVMEIADQLHSSGVTVIMSSHDTDLTYAWADEIHVLHGGKCIYSGAPEPFYDDHRLAQKAGLLQPHVFQMNKTLSENGKLELLPYPKTQTQMAVKMANCGDRDFGSLHIVKVTEGVDPSTVIAEKGLQDTPKGLFGLSARGAHDKYGFSVDYLYNGPENCIMNCLSGKDSVLICDPLMLDKAESSADFINSNRYGRIDVDVI